MTTKFILHGGESSKRTPNNEIFFRTILESSCKDKVNILCVYFARPEHRWQESFYEDRNAFEGISGDKSIYIKLAEKEGFEEQVKTADVIFINGGFKGFLKEALVSIKDLKSILSGKVVVGISAGANILSKYYYSQGGDEVREGIGLLPIKLICHYSVDRAKELEMLQNYNEDLPIYKIPEETFIVLDQ